MKYFFLLAAASCITFAAPSFAGGDGFDCKNLQQGQCQQDGKKCNWNNNKQNGLWEKKSSSGQDNCGNQNGWNQNSGTSWSNNSNCPQKPSWEQKSNWEQKANWQQNCGVKQGQWGQPGGSYPMKDGGQLTVDLDGTKHFRSADGSEKTMRPDGTGIWKRADGSSMEKTADGRKIYRTADGKETVMEQAQKN